jgi:hypothetical protein
MRRMLLPIALALFAAAGFALAGCGSSSDAGTTSRAAAGADSGPVLDGIVAAAQSGRAGKPDLLRCGAAGATTCDATNGAMGPVRSMQVDGGKLFVGVFTGDLLSCDPDRPVSCDGIGKIPGITSIAADAAVSKDATASVYVGTNGGFDGGSSGDIWRCPQVSAGTTATCRNVGTPRPDAYVASMVLAKGTLYAGLDDGRILSCTTGGQSLSLCLTFANVSGGVLSLDSNGTTRVVAGTDAGAVLTCPLAGPSRGRCTTLTTVKGAQVRAVASSPGSNTVYAGLSLDAPDADGKVGSLLRCDVSCTPIALPPAPPAPAGSPIAAAESAVTAVVPSSAGIWVGQGTVTPQRAQGVISLCPPDGSAPCTVQWSDPMAGVTAMAGIPAQ